MTRYLVTATKSKVLFRKITKVNRPLALVFDHLYRIDDDLSFSDVASTDSIIYYDLEEQQPWGNGDYLDPEFTKVMIDSLKMGKGKINRMFDLNFDRIAAIVMILVIAWAVVPQILGGLS